MSTEQAHKLLEELHILIVEDKDATIEGDKIRDELESITGLFTDKEMKQLQAFSEKLYKDTRWSM